MIRASLLQAYAESPLKALPQSQNYAPATPCCLPHLHLHQPRPLLHLQRLRRLPELLHLGLGLDIRLDDDRDRAVSALVVGGGGAGKGSKCPPPLLATLTSTFGAKRVKTQDVQAQGIVVQIGDSRIDFEEGACRST